LYDTKTQIFLLYFKATGQTTRATAFINNGGCVIKGGNSGDFSLLVGQYLPIFLACGEHRGGFAK
jgi:hypothetical protein